ncbi:TolC family protein, partial [bacterium]|nr:TolC family protein [bacterium]
MKKDMPNGRIERIHFLLPQIMKRLFFGGRQKQEHPEITIAQIRTLHVLMENDNCTMGELSDRASVTLGTMTNTVNRLVRNKLVKRTRSAKDRRLVQVRLTETGKAIIEEHQQRCKEQLAEAIQRLEEEDQERLLTAFSDIYSIVIKIEKTIIAVFVIFLLYFSPARADESLSLDLEESIKLALTNNRLIHAGQKDMALAREKIKEAKTVFLPQLSLGSSYTRMNEPAPTSEEIYEHQLNLSQFLLDGGQARALYEQTRTGLSLSKWQHEETKQELIFQVKKAYFGLLGTEKLKEVAMESVRQLAAHLEAVEKHVEVGILSSVELLRAEVELARAQANLIEAENGLSLAKASFNSLLGREVEVEVKIEDLPGPAVAELPSTLLKQRPELEQRAEGIKIAGLGLAAAQKSRFPVLSAFASYSRGGDELFGNEDSWMTGLALSCDLWDWGRKRSRIEQD